LPERFLCKGGYSRESKKQRETHICSVTGVRLQVEQNQLVAIFGEIVLGSVRFECP
jgi:hypothetical protein